MQIKKSNLKNALVIDVKGAQGADRIRKAGTANSMRREKTAVSWPRALILHMASIIVAGMRELTTLTEIVHDVSEGDVPQQTQACYSKKSEDNEDFGIYLDFLA